jgi:predicted AlkP superfamily pyrophosphatase or phosphodiesterase
VKRSILAALVLLASVSLVADWPEPPHVVMISIDGLMPSAYTGAGPSKLPVLRRLASEGAYARGVVGVFPTVTYPSHTTLVTGVPPAIHGVLDNRLFDPENRSNGAWYWYAKAIQVPTLAGAVRGRGLRAAAVSWPVTVGMDVDFLFPEYWRSDHPETLDLLRALSRPMQLVDDVAAARGSAMSWPLTDADRAAMAAWILRTHRPHLTLLHLLDVDWAEHEYGPGSPEALDALERADAHVAVVTDAVRDAGLGPRTNVVVVSDHGFLPIGQQLQPNGVFREEGLVTVEGTRVTGWQAWFHASGGAGFVYLRDPADQPLRERVGRILAALAADPANGVDRIWSAGDLRQIGAHPGASFALSMKPGFYTSSAHDVRRAATSNKGGHGFAPDLPQLHASLIVHGPDAGRRGDLGIVRMTQIAPTVARWLGVALSPHADEPLF